MIRAGIIGSTGYAGGELVRILLGHKDVEIKWYGSRSYIDKKYADVYQNMFQIVDAKCLDDNMEELAKQADAVILCLGNHPMQVARECYDRPDLELPAHQKALLRAVADANPNTVLTLVSSYPYALGEAQELVPAILYTTHAGPELGSAVAATLLGENNPAARCPITWYRSAQDLPDIMEYLSLIHISEPTRRS